METKLNITNKLLLFIAALLLELVRSYSPPADESQKLGLSILDAQLIQMKEEIYGNKLKESPSSTS